MPSDTQAPLPPIANALENFARLLRAYSMPPGDTVPAGPIRKLLEHQSAVLSEVARVETELLAAQAELTRIRPAEDFLAICREIRAERALQDSQWGAPGTDGRTGMIDWLGRLQAQADAADHELGLVDAPRFFRARMVKLAAVAVAAIQTCDAWKAAAAEADA